MRCFLRGHAVMVAATPPYGLDRRVQLCFRDRLTAAREQAEITRSFWRPQAGRLRWLTPIELSEAHELAGVPAERRGGGRGRALGTTNW